MSILLNTVIGSHLYGTSHSQSDYDYYVVTSNNYIVDGVTKQVKATQIIVNGVDTTTLPLSKFMRMADKCVPQALEAMFSTKATVDVFKDLRENYYINPINMLETYTSTINSHVIRGFYQEDLKAKKHAIRLALNLRDALQHGRFSPELSEEDKVIIHFTSQVNEGTMLKLINDYVGVELKITKEPF